MGKAASAGACHDRFRANTAQSINHVAAAPEQWHRRSNHAGAQDSEKRDNALNRVGQLHRHDRVGRQAEGTQPCRDSGDCVIGLCIAQAAWRSVSETLAVWRINERW